MTESILTHPRIAWGPEVEVLASTALTPLGWDHVQAFEEGTDAERIIELAGRVCYQSMTPGKGRPSPAFHAHIAEVGHGSLWEHASVTLRIRGVTRWLTHELVRQRTGVAYSQMSTRYVDASNLRLVVPARLGVLAKVEAKDDDGCWDARAAVKALYVEHEAALDRYAQALEDETLKDLPRKRRHELARAYLPANAETDIIVTFNFRALLHFFRQRGSEAAADEIRVLARAVWEETYKLAPMVLEPVGLAWDWDAGGIPFVVDVPRVSP